jgi:hypothetical protein
MSMAQRVESTGAHPEPAMNIQSPRPLSSSAAVPSTASTMPPAVGAPDVDAQPLATAPEAARFERASSHRSWLPRHTGGDSRVVLPAGGSVGQLAQQAAIDAHSRKAGDFTEARTVDGRTLFFTPAGAHALDVAQQNVDDGGATLHARADPGLWELFTQGDPFAGREAHSGATR